MDKTDLTVWSTEGSLYSSGVTRISVAARIRGKNGRLLASASTACSVQGYSLLRQTSQKDFVSTGPGRLTPDTYLSTTTEISRTFGARACWNSWCLPLGTEPPGTGLSAVTYPCHPMALPHGGQFTSTIDNSCATDGHIALATVELDDAVDPTVGSWTFVQHFDGPANAGAPGIWSGWDASFGAAAPGSRARATAINGADVDIDLDTATVNASSRPVWTSDGTNPSTLYPDGAHQQFRCWPAYTAGSNLPVSPTAISNTNRLAMSFWVKPCNPSVYKTLLPGDTLRELNSVIGISAETDAGAQHFRIHYVGDWSGSMPCVPQAWTLTMSDGPWPSSLVFPFTPANVRNHLVRGFAVLTPSQIPVQVRKPNARWHLVTAVVDTNQPAGTFLMVDTYADTFSPRIPDPGLPDPPLFECRSWNDPVPLFTATSATDVFGDPAARIQLGSIGFVGAYASGNSNLPLPNDLLDELAIANFGTTWTAATTASTNWATARYQDGRYAKDEGKFLSGLQQPASGLPCFLLKAWWTAYLPSDLRMDLPDGTGGSSIWASSYLPAAGAPRLQDSLVHAGGAATGQSLCRVSLDLLDSTGTLASTPLQSLTQGGGINRTLSSFRYRVGIKVELADPLNSPVLESPVFEDVTFAFRPASGPRILAWER